MKRVSRNATDDEKQAARKESERARNRRSYHKHKTTHLANVVAWKKNNPEKVREYYARNWAKHGERVKRERIEKREEEYRADPQGTWLRETFRAARVRAKRKGIAFDTAQPEIETPTHCPVLGIELLYYARRAVHGPDSPSLDRIIPERGYVAGNLRVISNRANTLKNNATIRELRLVLADMERLR